MGPEWLRAALLWWHHTDFNVIYERRNGFLDVLKDLTQDFLNLHLLIRNGMSVIFHVASYYVYKSIIKYRHKYIMNDSRRHRHMGRHHRKWAYSQALYKVYNSFIAILHAEPKQQESKWHFIINGKSIYRMLKGILTCPVYEATFNRQLRIFKSLKKTVISPIFFPPPLFFFLHLFKIGALSNLVQWGILCPWQGGLEFDDLWGPF